MKQESPERERADVRAVGPARCPLPVWWRRLGLGAFLFFLIKGLAWLALPVLAVWWRACTGG